MHHQTINLNFNLNLNLTDAESVALADLADAQGRTADDLVQDAVRFHLRAEGERVQAAAERLAGAHADLLRRLGE
ncbi:hypothetical protein [Streptomyces sp. NBC_01465]|uniref:hypothetical protein n=1 Tax=Streptomyces sp. NBC_01465 TaxID=2903878 RepID=UPI002E376B12|nr:hypothetical protein [Streptomyces sp. NBC_01465]